MCFNISIAHSQESIENQFNAEFHIDFSFTSRKHISAFANPIVPAITSENTNEIQPLTWGLIPQWVSDRKKADAIRKMTYNAKSETVHEKPSFRNSFKKNRCIVIADGFYEWQTTSTEKICHYITTSQTSIFAFAGIFSEWTDSQTGEFIKSTSILTQSANPMIAKIHNIKKRQPVILDSKHLSGWLDSSTDYKNILENSYNTDFKSKIINSPLKK